MFWKQLECADSIILNKIDLVSEKQLSVAKKHVPSILVLFELKEESRALKMSVE